MPGGLAQIASVEDTDASLPQEYAPGMGEFGPNTGPGLPDPTSSLKTGTETLNKALLDLPWGAIDEFRRRWAPGFNEAKAEHDAARAAIQSYQPPVDRRLPWLQAAAGFLAPTKTGQFGESLGQGIKGFADARTGQQQHEIGSADRMAQLRLSGAQQLMQDNMADQKMDLGILGQVSAMERARALMAKLTGPQKGTPTMQEYNWINLKGPHEEERKGLTEAQIAAETLKRQQLFNFRQGNAAVKSGEHPGLAGPEAAAAAAMITNSPHYIRAMKTAEELHPPEAYEGQPLAVRQAAIKATADAIYSSIPRNLRGAPNAAVIQPQAPAVAPNAAPVPQVPAAAPPVSPAESSTGPYDKYFAPPPQQTLQPGVVPSTAAKASAKVGSSEDIKSVQNYMDKEVYPGVNVADETRTHAIIAKEALRKNPNLTGAGTPLLASIGNWMQTLGIAPDAVKTFVNDAKIFESQAFLQVLAKQLAQKGVQTESDAARMLAAGIDNSKPVETNKFLIRYMEATADRLQERARFFDAYRTRNGSDMRGAVDRWNKYVSDHPMARIGEDGKLQFKKMEKFDGS